MKKDICKDKREFFRVALESLRGTGSEYCSEYKDFDSIPESQWEDTLNTYLQEVLCVNIASKNVDVDFENVDSGGEYTRGGLDGLMELDTGELFYCFDCGGDWECPVNAMIYVEDGRVKFHVPEKGNNFNVEKKCAYGNEDDDEAEERAQEKLDVPIDRKAELLEISEFLTGGKPAKSRKKCVVPTARFSSGRWDMSALDGEDAYSITCERTGREICRIPRQEGGIKRTRANALLIKNAPRLYAALEDLARSGILKPLSFSGRRTWQDRIVDLLDDISGNQER